MMVEQARLTRIRQLSLVLFGLSILVVLVSAYIRLKGAGLGCASWPDCYGQILSGKATPQGPGARVLHRTVASLALFLGFGLVWQCMRPTPIPGPSRPATALLVLMIVLTFVGLFSADPHRVWAGFINMLGGAGLVLLSWRCAIAAQPSAPIAGAKPSTALLHAGLGVLVLTLALGALIGARYTATSCPSLPGCGDLLLPPDSGLTALNPVATVALPAALGDPGGAALHLLHRWLAVFTVILLGLGALRALSLPATRNAALVVLLLVLLQFSLGVATVMSGFGLGLAIAHSVCASLLLAAGLHLLLRMRAG